MYEYSHADGGVAVTGGYVYRGTRIPNLVGAYVFADYAQGHITALEQRGGRVIARRELDGVITSGLSSFGQDNAGELYVLDLSGKGLAHRPGALKSPRLTLRDELFGALDDEARDASRDRVGEHAHDACGQPVERSRHVDGPVVIERGERARRDLLRALPEEAGNLARVDARALLELGAREPGTHDGDLHAGAAQLLVHRLREAADEGLGRSVGRVARRRLARRRATRR